MSYSKLFSENTKSMGQSIIRELLSSTKGVPGMISLAGGFPAPETFPVKILADLYRETILESGNDILQYGATEGDSTLKQEIKKLENIDIPDNEIVTTVGSTNGIYDFTRTFINSGDIILCEAPSFLGSVIAFEASGAEIVGIPMDNEGIIISELEKIIQNLIANNKKIKFLYTIPEFQNPTGITMSLNRRNELVDVMKTYEIPILEDNPYGALRYEGEKLPDLYKIAREKYGEKSLVTCVKSFSKILGPGMRLAYVISSPEIITKIVHWSQKVIVTPDCITQRVVANFLGKGLLKPHIKSIVEFYKPKHKAMLNALSKYMPKNISWTHPEGGMFVWIYLPNEIDADKIFPLAKEHKIAFVPGSHFFPKNSKKQNVLRLNFSYPSLEQIDEGVKRVSNLINNYTKNI